MKHTKIKLILTTLALSATLIGCTTTPTQESTGQYLDNTVITTKVKAKFAADKQIKSLPITVNSYKNTVQLSGFVNSKKQEARAVQLAQEVPGVESVKDDLIVK